VSKIILIYTLFLFISVSIYSQNKISINGGYGNYLINSENSLKIMEDKKYRSHFLFGIAYQREDVFGHNLMFEYSFQQITKEDIIEFVSTSNESPEVNYKFGGDISLVSHSFDLNYIRSINKSLSYGIGPSFVIVNRILEIPLREGYGSFYDRLASSGLGINGFLNLTFPLSDNKEYFFFNSELKFRYTHSIWFDKGIRNLDNYYQEFLTAQIIVGIGYSF